MPCSAEFGIIQEFDKDKEYFTYEPEKYGCVAINDDLLDDWWIGLAQMKTYFHSYSRPEIALARWGITLIPPESLEHLFNIVAADERSKVLPELIALLVLLQTAISESKYVIHFGV